MTKGGFFAYGTLKYGVEAGAGDVEGDGFEELATGPSPSPAFGSQLRGFDYDGGTVTSVAHITGSSSTDPITGFASPRGISRAMRAMSWSRARVRIRRSVPN